MLQICYDFYFQRLDANTLTVLGGDARLLVNDYLEMWAFPGLIGDYEDVDSDMWITVPRITGGVEQNTCKLSANSVAMPCYRSGRNWLT